MNGLNYIGKYKGCTKSTFTKKDNTPGENFDLKIVTEGATLNIRASSEPLDLEINNTYSFPIGANSFVYTDKETGEKKNGLSWYLRKNEEIEAV